VGSGVDSITYQGGGGGGRQPRLTERYPDFWWPMIAPPGGVRRAHNIPRESPKRMSAAQQAGQFKDEIIPVATRMKVVNKETKEESLVDYVVNRDECNRPETTLEG